MVDMANQFMGFMSFMKQFTNNGNQEKEVKLTMSPPKSNNPPQKAQKAIEATMTPSEVQKIEPKVRATTALCLQDGPATTKACVLPATDSQEIGQDSQENIHDNTECLGNAEKTNGDALGSEPSAQDIELAAFAALKQRNEGVQPAKATSKGKGKGTGKGKNKGKGKNEGANNNYHAKAEGTIYEKASISKA